MSNPLVSFFRLFCDVSSADEAIIAAAFESRFYPEGKILFREGKVCRELFFVCTGVLRVVKINDDGSEVTLFFIKENHFCSVLNSFTNGVVATESIMAACDATVLAISKDRLDELYCQLPYLQGLMTKITQQALMDKIAARNALLGQDATSRYRTFMMHQPDVALRVSQANIASYLCITPQSLSRIRKTML